MKVLVVEPMKKCYTKEINGLEEMQALVGGYIQAIYPFPDKAAVVCNEEGKNLGLPFNRPLFDENDLPYDIICGTFFVAGLGVEDFVSLTEEQIRRYKEHYDIAKDEQARLLRLGGGQKISLLEKYDFTEQDAKELCQTAGLLSPVYEFTDRGGCWFCPNAKQKELRHLYDHHPDLWNRMLELQAIPGKVSEKFDRKRRFSDIDALFRQEDACNEAAGKAA